MTLNEFGVWVVDTIGRDDITWNGHLGKTETTPTLWRWIESARRKFQQGHSYKAMEVTARVPLQPAGVNCVLAPCDIKSLEFFRIVNASDNQIRLIPKFIRDRSDFQRLINSSSNMSLTLDDPDTEVLFDVPTEASGLPIAISWWGPNFWLYPLLGPDASTALLEVDYIRFFPFSVQDQDPVTYTDFLTEEAGDAVFWRTMMEAGPFLRDQFQMTTLIQMFKDAEALVTRTDWERRTMYSTPIAMDPSGV